MKKQTVVSKIKTKNREAPTLYLKKLDNEHVKRTEELQSFSKYISEVNGKIQVRWKELVEDHHSFIQRASDGISDQTYEDILWYLYIKGILRNEGTKNSYVIYGCGLNLGPSSPGGSFTFARKEDAEAYKEVEYKGAFYSTKICKIL